MMLAYLDQNVLGHIRDGEFHPPDREDVVWLYSAEHLTEISRGGDTSLLSVLADLKAQEIEVLLDDQWRTQDRAVVCEYVCPIEHYRKHLETVSAIPFDQTLLTDLFAGFAGGNNYEDVEALPERVQAQLVKLVAAGDREQRLAVPDLQVDVAKIVAHLRERRSLESLREPLGFHGGRVGNFDSESVLHEIWKGVGDQFGDLAAERFFKIDPMQPAGGQERSKYQSIIWYHTILNFMGYRTDKGISSSAAIPNIISDAVHIAHAAFCQVLITSDHRLSEKALAIYNYMGIGTVVVKPNLVPKPA